MADKIKIKGFRNQRRWGKFDKPTLQAQNEALKILGEGKKYIEGVRWIDKMQPGAFEAVRKSEKMIYIGLGVWATPDPDPPPLQ